MTGHRTPLAYYLIGASQVLWGPSLIAGRLVSFGAGFLGLLLLWRGAALALGTETGLLTLALVAASPYLMAHSATAAFHGLAFFWMGLAVWCWANGYRVPVILCAWGLFLTRPQFGLVVPAAWLLVRRESGWRADVALLAPGVAFWLAFWPLKMLAYIPLAQRFVESLGYVPVVVADEPDWATRIGRAIVLVLRSYKAWIVLGLAGWAVWPVGGAGLPRPARTILRAFLVLAATQLAVVNFSWKVAVGYFPAFAPLVAIPLAARAVQCLSVPSARRAVFAVVLAACLLLGGVASPPSALPLSVDWRSPAAVQTARAAADLARLIPPDTEVFLYGSAVLPYLAGLRPPLEPSNHLETLVPALLRTSRQQARSGLWSLPHITGWLAGCPKPYALIWVDGLVARERRYGIAEESFAIRRLSFMHYARIGTVTQPPGQRLEVWKRKVDTAPPPDSYWQGWPCS